MRPIAWSNHMSVIERTPAGLQTVIPGCERRTLPRSTSRVDDDGQGLLHFTNRQALANNSQGKRMRLYSRDEDKSRYRKQACSAHSFGIIGRTYAAHRLAKRGRWRGRLIGRLQHQRRPPEIFSVELWT